MADDGWVEVTVRRRCRHRERLRVRWPLAYVRQVAEAEFCRHCQAAGSPGRPWRPEDDGERVRGLQAGES
ncbi:MAG: hypothetical protein OWV35_06740 [Firmicutes bacterium]|nr:hypothetical protein [Bacillota bacterium]